MDKKQNNDAAPNSSAPQRRFKTPFKVSKGHS
jgi:hypothetical protein